VTEQGRARTVSKQRALLKSMVAKAVQGDPRAMTAVVNLCARLLGPSNDEKQPDSHEDARLLDDFLEREIRRRAARTSSPQPENKSDNNGGS
jgi:hypothetical protein